MTEPDWLSRRTPPPPEELATAIRNALKARNAGDSPSSMELLETAQLLLQKVLESECAPREAALDLLTADALVTYALEVASDDPNQLGVFAERAMTTLANAGSVGDTSPAVIARGFK